MNEHKPMQIYVALKTLKKLTKSVEAHSFTLPYPPQTLRELIELMTRSCVAAYRARAAAKADSPLSEEQFDQMQEIGKFAFGVHYNGGLVDENKAVHVAQEAVEDGLVRVFCGDREMGALDENININDGDVLTFVRLTMLSGRMW